MADKAPVESKSEATKISPEKLANKKVYRTVNIDVKMEELIDNLKKPKASADKKEEKNEKSVEDYKMVLRGMGFKID